MRIGKLHRCVDIRSSVPFEVHASKGTEGF